MRIRGLIAVISIMAVAGGCASRVFGNELDGACWIGPAGADLPVYAPDLSVFRINFDFSVDEGKCASLLYGVDDPRLMNHNYNIFGIENAPGESAVKLEVDGSGKVSIYRYGYAPGDDASRPIAVFDASEAMTPGKVNSMELASNLGHTEVKVNGQSIGRAQLGTVGNGGDYTAFPVLAGMAVEIPDGRGGEISNIAVRNFREPANVIFSVPGSFARSEVIEVPQRAMPQVRTVFDVPSDRPVAKATITATARGIYDLEVNNRRATDDYFYPGSTQYNKTHLFHTFDITPLVQPGQNTVSAQLGEGWWSGPSTFVGENRNFFGDRQSFRAKIVIEYADGGSEEIATMPGTWEYSVDGPMKTGSFFDGEIYDATVEAEKREWKPAVEISVDSTVNLSVGPWREDALRPSFGDRVRAVDTLAAVAVTEPRPGVYIYDMGQNMAGVPMIDFTGQMPGTVATMRFAEMLYPDMERYSANKGMIMTENLRAAMCRDRYTARGTGKEVFAPRHTLHGFRYIEITGLTEPLPTEAVKAVVLSSVNGFRAGYECSDTLVNRLWKNIEWSTLSNFISIPTDCPQRNERLGWMGDISVFAPTATKLADVSGLIEQYMQSVRDCQQDDGRFPDVAPTGFGFGGLLWGSAGITVPYEYFRQYGDTALLREHYPAMQRYIDYIYKETIEPSTGLIVQNRAWGDLADWLSPEYDRTDKSLLWECYFIYDLDVMAEMARILGNEEDARRYEKDAAARREFFNRVYVDPITRKTRFSAFDPAREGNEVDTQVSYALPIAMGIVDDETFTANFINTIERENVADDGRHCPPYSLMTGFIGTAWIGEALSRVGRSDVAYRLLVNREYPSWLYPVTQGATTVWERLDSYTHRDGFGKNNSMNSFNHYSFGAVGNWLITRSAGIMCDGSNLRFAPQPDTTGNLTRAQGWLDIPQGQALSGWRRKGDVFEFEIETPVEAEFVDPFMGNVRLLAPGCHIIECAAKI